MLILSLIIFILFISIWQASDCHRDKVRFAFIIDNKFDLFAPSKENNFFWQVRDYNKGYRPRNGAILGQDKQLRYAIDMAMHESDYGQY